MVPSNRWTRFSVGGWVLNNDIVPRPDNGLMMNIWAVAGFAFIGTRREYASIFFRTILSENQSEPKFMTTANPKAMTRPLCPPSSSPITSSRPLSSPRKKTVFYRVSHPIDLPLSFLVSPSYSAASRSMRPASSAALQGS